MTKHSYNPYTSTYSYMHHNTNKKHNIHHTPLHKLTSTLHMLKNPLSLTIAATQQTSHRPYTIATTNMCHIHTFICLSSHIYTKLTTNHIHHQYAPSVTLTHCLFNCTHIRTTFVTPVIVDRPRWSDCTAVWWTTSGERYLKKSKTVYDM